MATTLVSPTTSSVTLHHHPIHRSFQSNRNLSFTIIRCTRADDNSTSTDSSVTRAGSESGNLLLKTAWYGSELLGIAASFFRSPDNDVEEGNVLVEDQTGVIDRSIIVQTIKDDFQRSYFVTGAVTLDAYEDDCEFADPAGSFKGLRRFKRNCSNFGSLIEKSNMKLMKWEDFEVCVSLGRIKESGIGVSVAPCRSHGNLYFQFNCITATGYTEYYLSKESGKVCRHVEHWNVPKTALFKQLLKPSRGGFWGKNKVS